MHLADDDGRAVGRGRKWPAGKAGAEPQPPAHTGEPDPWLRRPPLRSGPPGDTPGPRRHDWQLGAGAGCRPGGLAALVGLLDGMGREGVPCLGRDGR